MQRASAGEESRSRQAIETLSLADRLKQAEAKVQALTKLSSLLKEENKLLKETCSKLEAAAADDHKVLENLREAIEKDANEKAALRARIDVLEKVHSKVAELERSFGEVIGRSEGVYQEYKKALAALGAEPLPLLEPAEGSEGVLRILDWLKGEFEGLGEVMSVANENAASVSFEGLLGNLLRSGGSISLGWRGTSSMSLTRVWQKSWLGSRM
jgi:ABC-type transporter Mla subunit MlaD